MATKTGLDAQIGVAKESTYGTQVTVTKFFEFNSESVKRVIDTIPSGGIRAGKVNRARSGVYARHKKGAGGTVEMEIWNKGFGFWLEHMLGAVATSQPDVGGNPTVFDHIGSMSGLGGKGFTYQAGRPNSNDGTVHPFAYKGGKVNAWDLKTDVGGMAMVSMECEFLDEDTATGLAVASYPASPKLFSFQEAKISVAAAEVKVTNFNIRGNNNLKLDRYYTGGTRREPLEQGREYGGSAVADFESLTQYNRFVNATEVAFEALWEGETISGIYKYQLKLSAPLIRFDGETPVVESTADLKQPMPFVILDDSATILYRTTDATP